MQLLPMASSDKGWFFQCNYLGGKLENTEPIILAFELGARKAGLLPGCFLQVKKGFPGTDTELTRHFVTLFAEQHWWGVSIYIGGLPSRPGLARFKALEGVLLIFFIMVWRGSFLWNICILVATIVVAFSSTIRNDATLQQMDRLKFFLCIQFTFIEIEWAEGKQYLFSSQFLDPGECEMASFL